MAAELAEDGGRAVPAVQYLRRVPGIQRDEHLSEPSAGMVLHRVLAGSARTFLLNDMGNELLDETKRSETVGALNIMMQTRPVWAESAASELDGSQRATTQTERIHQSRVAMRRIRSNLGRSGSSSTRHGARRYGPSWAGTGTASGRPGI